MCQQGREGKYITLLKSPVGVVINGKASAQQSLDRSRLILTVDFYGVSSWVVEVVAGRVEPLLESLC
jgi:hypothetical protein